MEHINAEHSCVRIALRSATTPDHAEVCPLCLARYEAARECICVACEAPSCPDCAETLPGTLDVLCYACPVPTKH